MTDFQENQPVRPNVAEYTVSELAGALKASVEEQFGHVRLRAELSGVKRAASGHLYLTLKDDTAVLDGVCWRGVASRLPFRPEDGLEVICTGKLTTYPARSKYQMVIEKMEPAGEGALMALLEARKRALTAEGLFSEERKKPIPFLPGVIGVITSPTGAVIRDILHRLNDRFPRRVILWPVLVQGDQAADQVIQALDGFNKARGDTVDTEDFLPRPDVVIIARGGGSIEDLWPFNEEYLVRAMAASTIPVISAVGHETDWTLADLAADLRAPTPTAAAEMVVPVKAELAAKVADLGRRLDAAKSRLITDRRDRLIGLARGLPSPRDLLGLAAQKLDDLADRLPRGLTVVKQEKASRLNRLSGSLSIGRLKQTLQFNGTRCRAAAARLHPAIARSSKQRRDHLTSTGRMLESLSHKSVLNRGFALVTDTAGKVKSSAQSVNTGDRLTLTFHDGVHRAVIHDDGAGHHPAHVNQPTARKKPRSTVKKKSQNKSKDKNKDFGQGSLF